jgi:hypothetical protein
MIGPCWIFALQMKKLKSIYPSVSYLYMVMIPCKLSEGKKAIEQTLAPPLSELSNTNGMKGEKLISSGRKQSPAPEKHQGQYNRQDR